MSSWKMLGGELADECCFLCKDGGDHLRACDKDCLKAYHPCCLENKHGFLPTPEDQFVCDWHICFNCKQSSQFQCLCCPISVCHDCLGKVGFVELRKQQKGFCTSCLNKAISIEKNTDSDPRWVQSDYSNAEISDILFKDYWEDVKDIEHVTLVYLEEARVILNRKLDCNRANSEKFPDDDHKSDVNMFAENAATDKTIPLDSKEKQNKVYTSLKKNKSNKKTYIGWGSKELIQFLSSFGKDTSKSLGEVEIVDVIMGHIKENDLFNDNKKKSFWCDDKLQPLFRRRKDVYIAIISLTSSWNMLGIKKSSEEYKINGTCTNILLRITGLWDDVRISMLSDEDFVEEECNDLVSLVNKGLLERPTIAALEEKVATVHKDIVNHWIDKELLRLEREIDRAHIKGWRDYFEELMHTKKKLSTEAERARRLEEVPEIIADTEQEGNATEDEVAASNSSQENRVNADGSSTEAVDIDKDESECSRRKNGRANIEIINLDSDED
ncbi:unnamed protein product [Urochloa decumbens]|uniref:Uncharacterized protein n=1 Tax=Urochloa decumbens TaxID=240449 RepID=A0ABC9GQ96_9POAL